MKRTLAICIIVMAMEGTALASGGRPHKPDNLNFLGSDDRQSKHTVTQTQPDNPVSVPEPSSLILLGAGLVAIAVARRKHG